MVLTRMKMKMMMIMMSSETMLMTLITTKKTMTVDSYKKRENLYPLKA